MVTDMFVLAFASLGFLVGNIVGMTASSVVNQLIALLFAFIGGTAIALVRKLDKNQLRLASIAISSVCISCLLGVYLGVIVTQYQLLSPSKSNSVASVDNSNLATEYRSPQPYLRNNLIKSCQFINQQLQKGNLTSEEANNEYRKECDKWAK